MRRPRPTQGGAENAGPENAGPPVNTANRYAKLNGADFYRGIADAAEDGTALLFAAKEQLDILKSATEVYFDATFKVVPGLYYQLLTVFAPCGDAAFPVMRPWTVAARYAEAPYAWCCVCTNKVPANNFCENLARSLTSNVMLCAIL